MFDGIILGQGCKWIGRYSKRIKIEKGVERENFRDREKSKYNKILCINIKENNKEIQCFNYCYKTLRFLIYLRIKCISAEYKPVLNFYEIDILFF